MRYSKIICDVFYNIKLSSDYRDILDVHFTAAAHHFLILRQSSRKYRQYHVLRHRAHTKAMMDTIYINGDFTKAKDDSGRGLEKRESWDSQLNFALPDPRMFNSMKRDPSCEIGEPHPSDFYLNPDTIADAEDSKSRDDEDNSLVWIRPETRRLQ
jgi:hypothetical protein